MSGTTGGFVLRRSLSGEPSSFKFYDFHFLVRVKTYDVPLWDFLNACQSGGDLDYLALGVSDVDVDEETPDRVEPPLAVRRGI